MVSALNLGFDSELCTSNLVQAIQINYEFGILFSQQA